MRKNIVKSFWSNMGGYTSPVFLLLLLLSTGLWYVAKLSYTYIADVPVDIMIEDNKFKVVCVMEGTGYQIFTHRYVFNEDLRIGLDEVETAPSAKEQGAYIVNKLSLQNAISRQRGDVRIISIGDIPEITIIDNQE